MIGMALVIIIFLLIFLDYIYKLRFRNMTPSIRGPTVFPIIGCHHIIFSLNPKDAMRVMRIFTRKYEGVVKAWIFHRLGLMLSNPKELEGILSSSKHIKKSGLYDFLNIWLGTGLLLSSGSKWHKRRKIITPAFHFKILEEFVEIFDRQSSILVEKLRKNSTDGNAFNVYPCVTLATLDVISETSMGVRINAQGDPDCTYVKAVTDITEIFMHRFANHFIQSDLMFRVFAPRWKRRQDEAIKELHEFTENIIQERRAHLLLERTKFRDSEETLDSNTEPKKKMALLDILLQSSIDGRPLSNADIQEEVDTFMFEGHDTTASAVCFALYCISRHPDVQEKMFQEIRQVIGDDRNRPITYADLQNLKYSEHVIKESMRLYPPVPMIARRLTEDAFLNDLKIPSRTEIGIPLFIVMRNPKFFPDPDKFDPERHNSENTTEKSNPYAYIPFSAGPRNCIGQKFAMLETKSILSKILRHYELLPLGKAADPVMYFVMRSTTGINIGLRPRKY